MDTKRYWLDQEMRLVKKSFKDDKRNIHSNTNIFTGFLLAIFLLLFAGLSSQEILCRHCHKMIAIHSEVKPGTWTCPKKGCGYKNDNRIRYCGMCGSERQ